MNNHLSQDQLSMCILGRSTPEEEQHSRECPECRAELARFQEPVFTFRKVMQDWSDRESAPRLSDVPPRFGQPFWRWIPAGAAVVLLTVVPLYLQRRDRQRAEAEEAARQDALLMDAVSQHLSRTMPAPMEPIMALVPDHEVINESGGTQ